MRHYYGSLAKENRSTYKSWTSMLSRCRNPNGNRASIYYSQGITFDTRWLDFSVFLMEMGPRPEGKTLDRFPDKNGNYCKLNCRWATAKEQALNRGTTRHLIWEGVGYSLKDLAKAVGLERLTLHKRLKAGWSLEKAVLTSSDGTSRRHTHLLGERLVTLDEAVFLTGFSKLTLKERMRKGRTLEEAVALGVYKNGAFQGT